jgi:dolichol-phosphate mannosyltransferase
MPEFKPKVAVMIPTYNERENIGGLIQDILSLPIGGPLAVLVVDDDSPDGTADVVNEIGRRDPRVRLLLRKEKRGRGLAGIAGLAKALELGAEYVVEMDGDGSHQPAYIARLLEAAREHDLVLGSRFVEGGRDADRPPQRRLVTFLVRHFIRRLFSVPVQDVSSGFRCFRRRVLEGIGLGSLVSTGPSVVLEILYKAHRLGFSMTEVPIVFIDRKKGRTKLTGMTLGRTFLMALRIRNLNRHLQPLERT